MVCYFCDVVVNTIRFVWSSFRTSGQQPVAAASECPLVRNYARKKTRESLDVVAVADFDQLDELEGLGLAVVGSGESAVDL